MKRLSPASRRRPRRDKRATRHRARRIAAPRARALGVPAHHAQDRSNCRGCEPPHCSRVGRAARCHAAAERAPPSCTTHACPCESRRAPTVLNASRKAKRARADGRPPTGLSNGGPRAAVRRRAAPRPTRPPHAEPA
eukprot:scaffold126473_cov32-Tisochrysis_lutea.AAC.2